MGLFSSGNKYKNAAQGALASAAALKNTQSDIDFRRGLLSNIRQERIARAMIEQGEYSDDISSSSTAGAIANIDSSLAGETHYAYDTTARTQKIQDYNQYADEMYRKYQKQQKKRGQAIQLTAVVAGALTGGALAAVGAVGGAAAGTAAAAGTTAAGTTAAASAGAGLGILKGAVLGASLGQSVGNFATGNVQEGIQGLINTGAATYKMNAQQSILDSVRNRESLKPEVKTNYNWQVSSVDPYTNRVIPGSFINVPAGTVIKTLMS